MLKLQAKGEENFALFLEHRQLINAAYSQSLCNVDGKTYRYELKPQLFQFEAKAVEEPTSECEHLKKGKRKRKTTVDSETVNKYLKLLPKPLKSELATLPRHWEEPYLLPQLHGANVSGGTQQFRSNSAATYIIPNECRFYNHNVEQMSALLPQLLPSYDLVILDPPWRNKYIRRLKRAKQELGYAMLDNNQLALLPLSKLTNKWTLVAIWCTNALQHQTALETQLLPKWNLCLLHKLRWYKLNSEHQLIGPLQADATQKQPYEMIYVACRSESLEHYASMPGLKQTELLLSVPSIVHSHKPTLLPWLRQHVRLDKDQTEPNCLELFARYLQPQCTSIGLEVLKLMDERLYDRME